MSLSLYLATRLTQSLRYTKSKLSDFGKTKLQWHIGAPKSIFMQQSICS